MHIRFSQYHSISWIITIIITVIGFWFVSTALNTTSINDNTKNGARTEVHEDSSASWGVIIDIPLDVTDVTCSVRSLFLRVLANSMYGAIIMWSKKRPGKVMIMQENDRSTLWFNDAQGSLYSLVVSPRVSFEWQAKRSDSLICRTYVDWNLTTR